MYSTTKALRHLWLAYEGPTWTLAFLIYTGWLTLTWYTPSLPWYIVLPLGTWLVTWHSSLQHEILHGHPTRNRAVNTTLALPSLWLWLPYGLYKESHLRHHNNEKLTYPHDDPESYYVTSEEWQGYSRLYKLILIIHNTLPGRFILGPALSIVSMVKDEAALFRRGDTRHLRHWAVHIPVTAAVLYWVVGVCEISLLSYILLFAYPGTSLAMLRSFAEHRPAKNYKERSVIVEAGSVMRLLFLNNNYHVVHHDKPAMPWFIIPDHYKRNRKAFLEGNGHYVFSSYLQQLRSFFLTPRDLPVHPLKIDEL